MQKLQSMCSLGLAFANGHTARERGQLRQAQQITSPDLLGMRQVILTLPEAILTSSNHQTVA